MFVGGDIMDQKMGRQNRLRIFTEAECENIFRDEELCKKCEADGVDIGLLVENIQLSAEARLQRHDNALKMVMAFREAGERSRRKK